MSESPLPPQLRRLVEKADSAAKKADAVVREAIHAIRAELSLLAREADVGSSARERNRAYGVVADRMAKLSKRLDDILRANLNFAGRMAADRAADATGVKVKYSREHAEEVIALISPQQGENLAAVFTDKMARNVVVRLRSAVVDAFRENAVAGGSMKSLARLIDEKWQSAAGDGSAYVFTDSAGRKWNTRTYMAMNARTNAMRVYNDLLCANLAKASGSDLVRVSLGGDPHCEECKPWEGRILSATGATAGFPTYDEAKDAGCFHPNCVHTLEAVDETADADEIEAQRGVPPPNEADDPLRQAFDLAVEREMRQRGIGREEAVAAVSRERVREAIRNGLPFEGTEDAADGLTDEEVVKLAGHGHVVEFAPTKGTKRKPGAEGFDGHVMTLDRERVTAEAIRRLMGA